MLARTVLLAAAALVAACSKPEPPQPKTQAPPAKAATPSRSFESSVLNPPAPRIPEPPPPAQAQAPVANPQRVEPAKSAPASRPLSPPQTSSPPPARPRTDVAAARPSVAPEPAVTRLVSKVDPDFPREAVQAGVDEGNVRARMTLDADGNVTRVEILDANPRRVFDRAVVRSLSQWRYSDGAAGRTVDLEIAFRR